MVQLFIQPGRRKLANFQDRPLTKTWPSLPLLSLLGCGMYNIEKLGQKPTQVTNIFPIFSILFCDLFDE